MWPTPPHDYYFSQFEGGGDDYYYFSQFEGGGDDYYYFLGGVLSSSVPKHAPGLQSR